MFIFDGGILTEKRIAGIKLMDGELAAFALCAEEEAAQRLRGYGFMRLAAALSALRAGQVRYLHDGRPLP